MKQVTILGFDYAFATAIIGMADLLASVGVTWNYIHGDKLDRQFKVEIASLNGGKISCANNIDVNVHKSINDIDQSDLLIIPTIAGDIPQTLALNKEALPWIKKLYQGGSDIACNCTGAFLLAETGLLNQKKATTHWGFVDQFRQRYPQVKLQANQLITEDGQIFCSGGGTAWFDMSLFLIERYCGYDLAQASSRSYVFDIGLERAKSIQRIPGKRYHKDQQIIELQDWLETHFAEALSIDQLAARINMSPRTLKRRFKTATNETPLSYIQTLRIEAAKRLLEGSKKSIEMITQEVGYEDISSFIRLFKKHNRMSPGAYRSRFSRRVY